MAIDPIQFQGFTERQGFDPIKLPDPNPFLRENLGTIDASLRNLEQGNLANMKAKADAYSRDLAQLADFSQTLQGFLGTAANIYDKKAEASANALYYEDLASQENDIATLDEGERILEEGNNLTSKAAVAANRNGAPYSVSKRIAELGGLKGHYYRVKATQDIGAKYGDFYDEARRTDEREITFGPNGQYKVKINETDPTEVEESAIRAYLREQYMEQFAGISRGMIAKYAFPTMRQVDESRATANADRIALRDSERERMEALEQYQKSKDNPAAFQVLLDTYSRTVFQTKEGKVVSLQYGGAWKQLQTDLLTLAKAGQYVDLEGLVADMVNPDTGKKYMDDPVYSTKIKAIQIEINKAKTEAFSDSQRSGLIKLKKLEQEAVGLLTETTENPTEADYMSIEKRLIQASNDLGVTMEFSLLKQHRANFGQNAVQVQNKMAMYEMLEKAGELKVEDLLSEPPEIRQRFLERAQQQEQLRVQGYKAVDKEFESLIKGNPFVKSGTGIGAIGKNANLMYDHVVAQHRQRTNDLLGTAEYKNNPRAASYAVLEQMRQEITAGLNDPNSFYYVNQDGFSNFFKNKTIFNANTYTAANRRIVDINAEAQDKGRAILDSPEILERLVGKEAFAKAEENWGQPGYRMDPGLRYLADKLDLNPFNVIHRGRSTFGMTELPAMVELAALHQNANPDLKRGLNRIFGGSITENHLRRISNPTQLPVRATFAAALPAEGNLGALNSVNHPWFVAIGVNEGTRTADGGYTKNYYGHTDPGDNHNNRGTVSGGRGNPNKTPGEVDITWQGVLEKVRQQYSSHVGRFATPGTSEYNQIMFNILDLRVQAPEAVPDFVKRIPQIIAEGTTPEVIGRLRAQSFINPRTGRLEASGFNNNMERLEADQRRRAGNFRIQGGQ